MVVDVYCTGIVLWGLSSQGLWPRPGLVMCLVKAGRERLGWRCAGAIETWKVSLHRHCVRAVEVLFVDSMLFMGLFECCHRAGHGAPPWPLEGRS